MKNRGLNDKGVEALAEAVLRTAFEDALAGDKDAIDFIDSYNFELWVKLLGMDPDRMRGAVKFVLKQNGVSWSKP